MSESGENDLMMARQSILDRNHELHGFELLYRGDNYDVNKTDGGKNATFELLNNLCTSALNENLNNNRALFINVDELFIESPEFFPSQSDNIVLELLEHVPATESVLNKVKKLKKLGFKFALDDYVFEPERKRFLPLVSIVKVDVLACSAEELATGIESLKEYSVTLLAEKVEDFDMFTRCLALGFDLFQGYYIERPALVKGKKISSNQEIVMRLLSELTRKDVSVDEVTELLVCDPRLALKIILLVNSSLFSFVRKVTDVRDAVVMLGIEAVKRWGMIIALVSESESPPELFRSLLSRAKALELCAVELELPDVGDYFSIGLFSGLDAVLGVEMATILKQLSVSDAYYSALIEHKGTMGNLLSAILHVERHGVVKSNTLTKLELSTLRSTYWQGVRWADEAMESII